MKHLLLIVSVVLSVFFGGGGHEAAVLCEKPESALAAVPDRDRSDRQPNYSLQAVLPVQSARISEEYSSVSSPFRPVDPNRRTQNAQKYHFRVVKAGKVFDIRHFFIQSAESPLFGPNTRTSDRYIYYIGHLLI